MAMSCEQVDAQMIDFLYGELSGEDRSAFEAHLVGCERCRREVESFGRTRTLARAALDEAPPARVRSSIVRAAREAVATKSAQPAGAAQPTPARASLWDWLRARWAFPTLATIGALSVFVLAGRLFLEPHRTVERGRTIVAPAAEPTAPPAPSAPPSSTSTSTSAPASASASASAPAVVAEEPPSPAGTPGVSRLGQSFRGAASAGAPAEGGAGSMDRLTRERPARERSTAAHRAAAPSSGGGAAPPSKKSASSEKERRFIGGNVSGNAEVPAEAPSDAPFAGAERKRSFAPPPPPRSNAGKSAPGLADGEGAAADEERPSYRAQEREKEKAKAKDEAKGGKADYRFAETEGEARSESRADRATASRRAMDDRDVDFDKAPAPAPPVAQAPAPAPARAPAPAPVGSAAPSRKPAPAPAAKPAAGLGTVAPSKAETPRGETLAQRADRLFTTGRWVEAAAAYRDLLRLDPNSPEAPRWRQRLAAAQAAAPAARPSRP